MSKSRDAGWMWTRYWRIGPTECLGDDASPAKRLRLHDLWWQYFASFPNGARLLDLATGGGAVARLAEQTGDSLGLHFDVDGVDLADSLITPQADTSQGRSKVRITGNTDLEALPFGDKSFDGLASQFGIEYASLQKAIPEALRVLNRGGRGLFVMHHKRSEISLSTAARLEAYSSVIDDGRAFRMAERVFTLILRSAAPVELDRALAEFRITLHMMRQKLSSQYGSEQNVGEMVKFLSNLALSPRACHPTDALRRLAVTYDDVIAWNLRQRAQLSAALDEEGVGILREYLELAGGIVEVIEELRDYVGILLGWKLAFKKQT